MAPELGILADDLTGATDTGLQFAKFGHRTCVCFNWLDNPPCDVLVFDTDSRARTPSEARRRAIAAGRALQAFGARHFYKKIDSTARGNVGTETEGFLDALGADLAVICPAFPELGRTIRDGHILVRGKPLDQSEFARDPLWPATTASLETILRRQTEMGLIPLPLRIVRQEPAAIREVLKAAIGDGIQMVIADAETPDDLRRLGEAIQQSENVILPVGSAGLAEWLVGSLHRPSRRLGAFTIDDGPILVVAGTVNPSSITQVQRLLTNDVQLAQLRPDDVFRDASRAAQMVAGRLVRLLRENRVVVLTLVDPHHVEQDLESFRQISETERVGATEHLVRALGQAVERALSDVPPSALVLTGGDTARATCVALGAASLEVRREAAPGIPISLLQGGRWDGLPVVTKAGGFGNADSLIQVIQELEGSRR